MGADKRSPGRGVCPHTGTPGELAAFQSDIMVSYDYERERGKQVEYTYPWPEWYRKNIVARSGFTAKLDQPRPARSRYRIVDQTVSMTGAPMDWNAPDIRERKRLFLQRAIGTHMSRSDKLLHRDFQNQEVSQ